MQRHGQFGHLSMERNTVNIIVERNYEEFNSTDDIIEKAFLLRNYNSRIHVIPVNFNDSLNVETEEFCF